MFEVLKDFVQLIALVISIILNTVLTFLILTKSNNKMGSYKYIMMYFSLSALMYSALSLLVRPDIMSYSSCFVVYIQNSSALFNSTVLIFLMSSICGFFFFFASLIAVHFVYRYNAIKNGSKWAYFQGKYSVVWFLISPFLYLNWTANCLLAFQPNSRSTSFLRPRVLRDFGIEIESITYIIADFYDKEHGEATPILTSFVSAANFMIMTVFSLTVMIVYAFKCYFEMTRVVVLGRNHSLTHKLLHTQLFRALIYQSLIPLIIMYLPLFTLFVFPMLNIDIGFAHYVSISISAYPALDALPTLILVRDYRDSLCKCFRLTKEERLVEPYYIRRNSVPLSASKRNTVQITRVQLG